jgi:hypothetical protein
MTQCSMNSVGKQRSMTQILTVQMAWFATNRRRENTDFRRIRRIGNLYNEDGLIIRPNEVRCRDARVQCIMY